MDDDPNDAAARRSSRYEPSAGLTYGIVGVVLLAVGCLVVAKNGAEDILQFVGLLILGSGLYVTACGAVARGVQLARIEAEPQPDDS